MKPSGAPTEAMIQLQFRKMVKAQCPSVYVVAVPNAGKRGPAAVRQLQAEGIAPGFPDTICIWRGGIGFIEFKRPGGKASANQAEWVERLRAADHHSGFAYSHDDALDLLRAWGAPFSDQARDTPRMDWEVA
jgi:VRR-NUC domain